MADWFPLNESLSFWWPGNLCWGPLVMRCSLGITGEPLLPRQWWTAVAQLVVMGQRCGIPGSCGEWNGGGLCSQAHAFGEGSILLHTMSSFRLKGSPQPSECHQTKLLTNSEQAPSGRGLWRQKLCEDHLYVYPGSPCNCPKGLSSTQLSASLRVCWYLPSLPLPPLLF